MLSIRKYVRVQSPDEAYALNQSRGNRILGGMLWLKMSRGSVDTAIDLCNLGLDTIEENETSFSIGAYVTLRQLEKHGPLNAYTNGAFREAVKSIVGVQFRNLATVGGSIWGRFGFSDVLTAFLGTDTYVELYKKGTVPLAEFVSMPYDRDVLLRVIVKKTPISMVYTSMRNQSTDFPVLTCAVSRQSGIYKTVIGARPGRAVVMTDTEGILSSGITRETADAFASFAAERIPTGSNMRAGADYRTHLIHVLTRRALLQLDRKEGDPR